MHYTIDAVFDGRVFIPAAPLPLEPNTRVRITVDTAEPRAEKTASFLETAQSLDLDGPPDWSENVGK